MKEIINEWREEVYKRHGNSGYTFVTIEHDYPNDKIIITTSNRLFWRGLNEELFNKYSTKLKEKGYLVEVNLLPFNSITYSLHYNLF